MLNWFLEYDRETYLRNFSTIDYSKYNFINNAFHDQGATSNPNKEQICAQFKLYQRHKEGLQKIQDPFASIYFDHTIKQLSMIQTMFETEGLLGDEPDNSGGALS